MHASMMPKLTDLPMADPEKTIALVFENEEAARAWAADANAHGSSWYTARKCPAVVLTLRSWKGSPEHRLRIDDFQATARRELRMPNAVVVFVD